MVPEPAPSAPSGAELLRGLCGGAVHLPGDPAYDEARLPWNLQADSHPGGSGLPGLPPRGRHRAAHRGARPG